MLTRIPSDVTRVRRAKPSHTGTHIAPGTNELYQIGISINTQETTYLIYNDITVCSYLEESCDILLSCVLFYLVYLYL